MQKSSFSTGRLPNKKDEESKSDIDMKRAVALRNWEYLRLVAKSIGQQRRQHARKISLHSFFYWSMLIAIF